MIDLHVYCSLLPYNTFGIDTTAARLAEYDTVDDLRALLSDPCVAGHPLLHIGAGSNLLFTRPYEGTVLHSRIRGVQVLAEDEDCVEVRVGAAEVWDNFVALCVERGWHGVENLSLIPGEVGAAAVQNIGAYGVEVKDVVKRVETMDADGCVRTYGVDECCYAYRDSLFKRNDMKKVFVTHVCFSLHKHADYKLDYGNMRRELERYPVVNLANVRQAIIDIRRAKLPDPSVLGNAGSFFKNPVIDDDSFARLQERWPSVPHYEAEGGIKIPAGWLIEQCGWKGKSLGPAAVYDKQALVLVNTGGATGADVLALCRAVQRSVADTFGIDIRPEVNIL